MRKEGIYTLFETLSGGVGMDMMGIGVKVTSETIFEFTYAE